MDYFISSDFRTRQRNPPVLTLAELAAHVSPVIMLSSPSKYKALPGAKNRKNNFGWLVFVKNSWSHFLTTKITGFANSDGILTSGPVSYTPTARLMYPAPRFICTRSEGPSNPSQQILIFSLFFHGIWHVVIWKLALCEWRNLKKIQIQYGFPLHFLSKEIRDTDSLYWSSRGSSLLLFF